MPIIKSAQKRMKQTLKRTEQLRPYRTRVQTLYKNVIKWAQEGNTEKIKTHLNETYSAIDTAAKKGILHKNTAARKKSTVQKALGTKKVVTA